MTMLQTIAFIRPFSWVISRMMVLSTYDVHKRTRVNYYDNS
jgi:hypothetical protein